MRYLAGLLLVLPVFTLQQTKHTFVAGTARGVGIFSIPDVSVAADLPSSSLEQSA